MSSLQNNKKTLIGVLLQSPMWIVSIVGIWMALKNIIYSFCSVAVTSGGIKLRFIGLENYIELFTCDPSTIPLIADTFTNLIVALILCIGVIVSALFISKLKSVFGMITIAVLSLCSLTACFVAFPFYAFNSSSYGYINSFYLLMGVLKEPVDWFNTSGNSIYLMFGILSIVSPIFLITYFFAKRGKKTLGVILSVCAMPVLLAVAEGMGSGSLPIVKIIQIKGLSGQIDYPSAIWVIAVLMFVIWCAVTGGVIFGVSRLIKLIKLPQGLIKVVGYILFAVSVLNSFVYLFLYFILMSNNSFKPTDEFFLIPQSYFVKRPTFSGFEYIFNAYGEYLSENIVGNILSVFLIALICMLAVVPAAAGLAVLQNKKLKVILPLCLLPVLGFIPFPHLFYSDTSIAAGAFLSGAGFLTVFIIGYILTKLTFATKSNRIIKIVLSVLCVVSTAILFAVATVNFNVNIVSNYLEMYSQTGDIAPAFAGEFLQLLVILSLAIVPAALFISVYILSKKKPKEIEKVKSED